MTRSTDGSSKSTPTSPVEVMATAKVAQWEVTTPDGYGRTFPLPAAVIAEHAQRAYGGWLRGGHRRGPLSVPARGDTMTINECQRAIGRGVVYRPHPGGYAEDGVITSVNDVWAFVRYGTAAHSKATSPRDLELLVRP